MKGSGGVSPIRMVARDLYRLAREVERLERALCEAPADRREKIEDELRQCRAERERAKRILEGHKQEPASRGPR